MRITNLSVDRFGLRSNLILDQLSPELNLIYGPNGTGKRTAIQFVRWVLFGRRDDATQRYLSARRGTSAGSLSASRGGHDFAIRREDDGSPAGRVSVTGNPPVVANPRDTQSLVGGIGPDEFDRLCVLTFDRALDLDALLEGAHGRGPNLICRTETEPRQRELQEKLDDKRRELAALPDLRADLAELQGRRQRMRQQLESAAESSRQKNTAVRSKLEQLTSEIQRIEVELTALRDAACELETKMAAEQRNIDANRPARAKGTQQFLEHRRHQLVEMDAELDCWCHMLEELEKARKQRESVSERHGVFRTTDDDERPDGRACPVDPVAQRVRQLREQWSHAPSVQRIEHQMEQANLTQTLDWLQVDVGRLCQQLQDGRDEARKKAMRGEIGQLRICYESLTRVVETLRQRREDLAYELWAAERSGVSDRADSRHGMPIQLAALDGGEAIRDHNDVTVSVCGCISENRNDSPTDRHQTGPQQDALRREIQDRKHDLHQLRGQLQQLQTQPREQPSDVSIQELQRELQTIESQIVALDEHDCLRRTIVSLERELDRVKNQDTRPEILRKASAMLRRLTGDRCASLRITSERQLWVDASPSQAVAYDHLSHGTRDQVCLCLGLAILAAYRQRGIALPLILNDAFVNVDTQRGQAMAELVYEYASEGNQVLLFTRHRHVIELFRNRKATLFELRPAGETQEPRSSCAEHRTVGTDEHSSPSAISRTSGGSRSQRHPQHERYVIRRRQWTAEEFPGELTDRVRVAPRDRLGSPAARMRIRQANIESTKPVVHDAGQQEPSPHLQQHVQPPFFLTPSDPVTNAPSIGPQTARKLERLGVKTVADLQSIQPETAVAQMGDSRISSETIRQWQAQSNLMCRVPRLRALDARALVQCAVTTVERLAQSDPRSLRKAVAKALRSMTRDAAEDRNQWPDLTTVASWILWAKSTTARRAA